MATDAARPPPRTPSFLQLSRLPMGLQASLLPYWGAGSKNKENRKRGQDKIGPRGDNNWEMTEETKSKQLYCPLSTSVLQMQSSTMKSAAREGSPETCEGRGEGPPTLEEQCQKSLLLIWLLLQNGVDDHRMNGRGPWARVRAGQIRSGPRRQWSLCSCLTA